MAYTHIDPGKEIQLSEHFYSYAGKLDVSDLISQPLAELMKQEQASIEKEKEIFGQIRGIAFEWTQQAQETARLRQAQQYLKTPPVKHTSNVWTEGEYDLHEISNMVYSMTWQVYEHTRYDRAKGKSVIDAWELSWYVNFNTPREPDDTRPGRQLAGQDRKRYTDKAAMEKYLRGRIAAYAHLFTEISPPIPRDQAGRFSVNGVLLPGYTVEAPERTPQEVADDLLDFLDDDDTPSVSEPAPAPAAPHTARPAAKKRSGPKRSGPVR